MRQPHHYVPAVIGRLFIPCFLLAICLFIQPTITHSQEWTTPKASTCYSGIQISVINMGKGSVENDFLWGVKFTNLYPIGVTFRYKLSIGEKVTSEFGGDLMTLKRKGDKDDTKSDSKDKFEAKLFHNPSEEWYVYIWDVCFEGMRCGVPDGCYASCDIDKDNPKPNQPCGLSSPGQYTGEIDNSPKEMSGKASATKKNDNGGYSGEYTTWMQEGKDIALTIGKTEDVIYWKKKEGEPPVQFKLLIPGVYRYDMGQDFMMIKFESENRLSLWNTGNLVGYFTRSGGKQNQENESIAINDGVWKRGTFKANIKMGNGGILFQFINSVQQPVVLYKKTAANEYKFMEPDGVHYNLLVVKSPDRINYFEWDIRNNMGDYVYAPDPAENTVPDPSKGVSAMNLKGTWKATWDKNVTVTIVPSNEDEFEYKFVVGALIKIKGTTNFKRDAENVFRSTEKCRRGMVTYISNDKLKIGQYTCSGSFHEVGELYRVGN